eukprot:179245-Pyramimonas_sp.AAC.1
MAGMVVTNPKLLPGILFSVGVSPIVDWVGHFSALGAYDVLYRVATHQHTFCRTNFTCVHIARLSDPLTAARKALPMDAKQ